MADNEKHLDTRTIVALGLWATVGITSLLLAGRAMVGAFDEEAHPALPILVTSVAMIASLSAWSLFHGRQRRFDSGRRLWDGLLALAPPALIGFATCQSSAPTTLGLVVSMLVVGLTCVVLRESVDMTSVRRPKHVQRGEVCTPRDLNDEASSFSVEANAGDEISAVDPSVLQQITRRPLADGGEEIEAVVLAQFHVGERLIVVHLPIHPPFRIAPVVECEPLDVSDITIHVTAAYGYGVRLEAKRSGPTISELSVPIGLLVTSRSRTEAAA